MENVNENEKYVIEKLSCAIADMKACMPILESMNGIIPTEILDLLDEANELTTRY